MRSFPAEWLLFILGPRQAVTEPGATEKTLPKISLPNP